MYAYKAYKIAYQAHKGQKDKGGNDYILHPCAVANMLESDIDKAVAYLHDVVEDTEITIDDLKELDFPDIIINAVDAITKRKNETYDAYIERVAKNNIAKKVKLADIKHNLDITRIENPTMKDYKRINNYKNKIEKLKTSK